MAVLKPHSIYEMKDPPELIHFCLTCPKKDCDAGICRDLYNKARVLAGLDPMPRRDKPMKRRHRGQKVYFDGEWRSLPEWAQIMDIDYTALISLLRGGWPIERALTLPTTKKHKRETADEQARQEKGTESKARVAAHDT